MKFEDGQLKNYLVKNLQPLTEADPALLANYVVALLKNNKPKKELQKLCIDQLFDFLGDGTKQFVAKLFHALEDGTIGEAAVVEASRHQDTSTTAVTAAAATTTAAAAAAAAAATPSAVTATAVTVTVTAAATVASTVAVTTAAAAETMEPKVSPPHVTRLASAAVRFVHDAEESSDEDDDRNHKHRRRVSRSRSFDRDMEEDERGSYRKRSRSTDNGQLYRESQRHMSDYRSRGSSNHYSDRREREHALGLHARMALDSSLRSGIRSGLQYRGDPRFLGVQRGLSRGRVGGNGTWIPHDQRFAAFPDGGDYPNALMPQPSNYFSNRGIAGRGGQQWTSFGHLSGNGSLDHSIPLSAAAGRGIGLMVLPLNKPRCLDFEERGYCLRGDLCPMEHGANRIVVEDVQSLSKLNLPVTLSSTRSGGVPTSGGVSTSTSTAAIPTSASTPMAMPSVPTSEANARIARSGKEGEANTAAAAAAAAAAGGGGGEDGAANNSNNNHTGNAVSDSYDPDQPLWGKERQQNGQPGGQPGSSQQGGQQDQQGQQQQEQWQQDGGDANGLTVWDRIGPVDYRRMEAAAAAAAGGGGKKQGVENGGTSSSKEEMQMMMMRERAQRTLFVRCIPSELNKIEALRSHFQKFGEIVDVRIPAHGDRAFVQFSRREDAEAALISPDAVLGNRFIRLSWANRDNKLSPSSSHHHHPHPHPHHRHPHPHHPQQQLPHHQQQQLPHQQQQKGDSATAAAAVATAATTAAATSTAAKKQEEVEQMKEEIRKKQQALAQKRDEFRKQLDKLAKQGVEKPQTQQQTSKSLHTSSTAAGGGSSGGGGGGGDAAAAPSAAADNRTSVMRVLPPLPWDDVGMVRENFAAYGEISEIEAEEKSRSVKITFATRRDAERAFAQAKSQHSLNITWVSV